MMCVCNVWALLITMSGWPGSEKCEELLERAKHGHIGPSREAFKGLLGLANEGQVQGQFHVAECYEQGWGTRASADKATEWYEAAGKAGHPFARIRAAGRKLMEAPDRRTMGEVVDMLKEVAGQGNARARVLLALATARGLTTSSGVHVSLGEKGLRRFAFLLRHSGRMPFFEREMLQNVTSGRLSDESVDAYRSASAAGSAYASLIVAMRYDERGKFTNALQILNSAVPTADALELMMVSTYCRSRGTLPGRLELADRARCEAVAVLAVRVGRRDPDAARLLAVFYGKAIGNRFDDERARTWLKVEASMRRPLAVRGDVESQYRLGRLIELGIAKSSDGETAIHWFRQAAEHGHALAQLKLGQLLEKQGKRAEAVEWFNAVRKQGLGDTFGDFTEYQ